MAKQVPRHKFDAKPGALRMNIRIGDESLVDAFAEEVVQASVLEGIINRSITALPMRSHLDPKDPAILVDLQRMACAAAGIFRASEAEVGDEVTIPAPNKQSREVISQGPRPSAAHTLNWQRGFYAALASREREATEILTQVPVESLRKGQIKSEPWFYTGVEALQAFVRKRDDAGPKLVAAMKATDPETCAPADKNLVLDLAWPVLELAYQALLRDAAAFDAAMVKALDGHRHFYTKADGKGDILGMMALGPLAMAVWAKDLGVNTTVESDYIPRWIIDR